MDQQGTKRLLLVEDDEDDFLIVKDLLAESSRDRYELDWSATYADAQEKVQVESYDGVLVDYRLGAESGLGLVREIAEARTAPVIVLTGHASREVDNEVLEAGASDFLVKGELNSAFLERAIRYAIRQHQLTEEVRRLSLVDSLTGLHNRLGFITFAEPQLKLALRRRAPALLLFVDLDGMKEINDTWGHEAGDHALADAAQAMRDVLRETDVIGRLGGDEFAALVVDAGPRDAPLIVKRMEDRIEELMEQRERRYSVRVSIGVAGFDPDRPEKLDKLLSIADAAMYREKRDKGCRTAR